MLETSTTNPHACIITLPADWLTLAKLRDTERGTRASGFAVSMARKTDGRIARIFIQESNSETETVFPAGVGIAATERT